MQVPMIDIFRMKCNRSENSTFHESVASKQEKILLLTTLEYKVFMLLREGFTKKECSQRLHMKRRDLIRQIKSVYRKLQVKSLAELIMKYR